MFCMACGARLSPGTTFCQACGAAVLDPAPVPASGSAQTPPFQEYSFSEFNAPAQPVGAARAAQPFSAGPRPAPPYVPPVAYPPPYSPFPGFPPPPVQPPKRSSKGLIIMFASMAVLLVIGSICTVIYSKALGPTSTTTFTFPTATINNPTTTSGESPTALYNRIFSTTPTFTDALTNKSISTWVTVQHPAYGCQFVNNSYHVFISDTLHFYYCSTGYILQNFAFQVQMSILKGDEGGITFRTYGLSLYFFGITPAGIYRTRAFTGDNSARTLSSGVAPIHQGYNMSNKLAVIAQGSTFDLYINGNFVNSFTDTTFSEGHVALMANDIGQPTEVAFNNAQIWML